MTTVPLTATFSTAGSYTWTCPAGVATVTVICTGAGGGGGAAAVSSGSNGGGGGGGEAALSTSVAVTTGIAYQVVVGAGGAGGTSGGDGSPGGDSTFTADTATITAHGGKQGTAATGGAGQGGAGGDGSTNLVSAAGGAGDDGTTASNGGGGGGAAGVSLTKGFPGKNASGSTAGGASGGTWAGGAGGAGSTSGASPGTAGTAPGGGGGGALSTGTGRAGGAGADGQVIITWTMTDPVTLSTSTVGGVYSFTAPSGATSVTAQAWGAGAGGFNNTASAANAASRIVAGATIAGPTYGINGSTVSGRLALGDTLDGFYYANRPVAWTAQKTYFNGPSSVITSTNQSQPVGAIWDKGIAVNGVPPVIILCYLPTTGSGGGGPYSQTDYNAITGCLQFYMANLQQWSSFKKHLCVILCQEPNGAPFSRATAPVDYRKYWNFYAPAVKAASPDIPLFFDGAMGGQIPAAGLNGEQAVIAFAQELITNATVPPDAIGVDYYGPEVVNGHYLTYPKTSAKYPGIWDVANNAGIPAGLYEWGNSASGEISFADYDNYVLGRDSHGNPQGFLCAYEDFTAAGKATSHIVSYCSVHASSVNVVNVGQNTPSTPTFPASGHPVTNTNSYPVFVNIIGGTGVTVDNSGGAVGNLANVYEVGAGKTITVTYTKAPTWRWWADYRSVYLDVVYDTVMGGGTITAAGGAGGGGGEFAQETSLAITDGHSYTLAVGAGGQLTSGGNSTIAGDSVTVTAHGGSVASSTSTGGSGGSGSSNAVHHSGGAGGAGGGSGAGGGGGGGSGGTGAAGNAGGAGQATSGGAGGTAVTGGGAGANGGAAGRGGASGHLPGGGGSGDGSTGQPGSGADGQVVLSGFVTSIITSSGSLALQPFAFSGASTANDGNIALQPFGVSATGNVCRFNTIQISANASGTGSFTASFSPSVAGNLLVATMITSGTATTFSGPPGWLMATGQNAAGGGGGRAEIWYYPSNPGGATSATFSAAGFTGGQVQEFMGPAGTTQLLDSTGTASGTNATSFPVTTSSAALGGDLGIAVFENQFSSAPSGSWTTPTGWNLIRQTGSGNVRPFSAYWDCVTAGTVNTTGTFSTSTNEIGWAAVVATFQPVVQNTSTGMLALTPFAFSGTGTVSVPPGTVVCNGGISLSPFGFESPSTATTFPQTPLPIMVEILINGVWTDITDFVYQRDGITISGRGRPDEASTAQPTQCSLTLNNRGGDFTPQNTQGNYYPYLARNTQIRISVVNAVTPQGSWYSGYRFWGEVPSWPILWDPSGSDVYVSITAAGVLQRMRQSKTLGSSLFRYYNTVVANSNNAGSLVPAGYWPCEDGTQAVQFASGLPGGSPMTWSGTTPTLAADTNVAGSNAFAQLNGSTWTGTPGVFSQGGITFTTPGTAQWVCPAGVTSIEAETWGAGGGGSNGIWGTGGAGGEYAAELSLAVTPGNAYTYVVGAGGSGGGGSFSGTSGSNGGNSTFKGDTGTVRAHGGKGGPSSSTDHADGGTGSSNSVHFDGGRGAANDAGNGGSGGGSSAGSSASGNRGGTSGSQAGGSGGVAVPDGGPGGAGGQGGDKQTGNTATPGLMPFPGPGGGGGGGGFNGFNNYGKPGGGGQAGQVRISFGSTATPPANVLRFVLDVPSTGAVDGFYCGQIITSGDVVDLHVKYHTANNGSLELRGNDGSGTQLFSTGTVTFGTGVNGHPLLVSAELTQKSSNTIKWKLTAIVPNATMVVATYTGTISGKLGSVETVSVNNNVSLETGATGVGHVSVQYAVDPILNLAGAFAGYAGELAAARFERLCGEQNVPFILRGSISDTPQMGPQSDDLLVNLLQECETADLGLMYEPRDSFGLGYITRIELQNQAIACTVSYSGAQLAQGLAPTDDDQLTRNDITITRTNGSSYEAQLNTGTLSTQDPPNGVGLYAFTNTVNLFADSQLINYANWLLSLGTVDEYRYPVITFDLTRTEVSDGTFWEIAALDIGQFLQIINPLAPPDNYSQNYSDLYGGVPTPAAWLPPMPISQLCFGFTENLNAFQWTIAINAVPEDPYTAVPPGSPFPTW